MMQWLIACVTCLSAAALGGCETTPKALPANGDPVLQALSDTVAAFNAHDVQGMKNHLHPEMQWFGVTDDEAVPGITGRDAMVEFMTGYFQSTPDVRSVVEDAVVTGPYVAFRERVTWTASGKKRHQSALGIYEVRDGLVRRVWYFPSVE